MSDAKVVVAGDIILDSYIWGKVRRISPEAPVPVVEVEKMDYRLGGAANVAANVAALGANVKLVGIVGNDNYGREMISLLEGKSIPTDGLVEDGSRPTTLKTRVIGKGQQMVRYDCEVRDAPSQSVRKSLARSFEDAISKKSIVVLSDYDKGVFRGSFAKAAIKSAEKADAPVAVDPKVPNIKKFTGAFVITPNHHEAGQIVGFDLENDEDVERAGKILASKLRCRNVLITRGKDGMSLYRDGKNSIHVPTVEHPVFDRTGAGDTAIAALSAAIGAGGSVEEAMWIANAAGFVAVGKLGTATVAVHEIEAQLTEECNRL